MKRALRFVTFASLAVSLAVVVTLAPGQMLVQTAWADDVYGRIRGTVTDSTGAIVTGVEVEPRLHRRSQARDEHYQPGIWTQLGRDLKCRH